MGEQRRTYSLPRLMFDGDESKYELWETKMLGHFLLSGLKDTVLREPQSETEIAADAKKNADAYAELILLLDDKSLSLFMRDAPNDGRKALEILRGYYAGKGKPRIISFYTMLTSLQKANDESVMDYIIRAETAITALRNAVQNCNFEETEKIKAAESSDSVMKTHGKAGRRPAKTNAHEWSKDDAEIMCFKCGTKGHRARACRQKVWCSICRRDTHKDATCRRKDIKDKKDGVSKASEDVEDYAFKVRDRETSTQRQPTCSIKENSLMVDTGATFHIITDITMFKSFDSTFRPEKHSVELADGTRCNGVAQRKGNAEVFLIDSGGQQRKAMLKDALFIPSYPQSIFSVKAATAKGATVVFKENKDTLINNDGTKFNIHVYGKLYNLHAGTKSSDKCNACHDIQTWHEILGHCNYKDVIKLQGTVEGMKIKGKTGRPEQECEVCIQGKFAQTRNRDPDVRSKAPLQMVHTDLAGPVATESMDGYKYVQSFTDDYSSVVFVYFLKRKSDTVQATEKFLADVSPYGKECDQKQHKEV
ncbi:hypothetical protein C0J50_19125 [Silurus asotus]|uniref:CCHC-type domain-containing protein n=1 Tax=Silurus asotus TaxID=30991 RepID=A0AAD5FL67_SILAS|nr:hypothetical protein C0J50_19125 [Silurus asotus]